MTRHHLLAAAASALMISTAACQVASTPKKNGAEATSSEQGAADRLARVDMQVDTSYLSGEERQVVNLLIQAADLMNPIYLRQVSADNVRLREEIAKSGDKVLLDRFDTFMGPWDETEEDKPFYGNAARPVGAGFYPGDLTKDQFDAYLAAHPDQKDKLTSPYTVVKRQGDTLIAVPYSE